MKLRLLVFSAVLLCMVQADEVVKVSQFNPSKSDATKAVQAAIDSGAKKVIFDNPGYEYLVEPIFLRSNQEVVIADGVVVRAMPDKYYGVNDSLFTLRSVDNVVISGEGTARLVMNKRDYQDMTRYKRSEWRHAISILSSRKITVKNLQVTGSGGDGVYIGVDSKNAERPEGCRDIVLENLDVADHHRLAIAIISGEDVLIRNCKFLSTEGTPPGCGIDLEPNKRHGERIINCVIEDCEFNGNSSAGIIAYIGALEYPVSVTFRNCRIADNRLGIHMNADCVEDKPQQGIITFEKCVVTGSLDSSFIIRNQRAGGLEMKFKDCIIENTKSTGAPILLYTEHPQDFANVEFDNLLIKQDLRVPVIAFTSLLGAGIGSVKGSVTVQDKSGKTRKFDLAGLSKTYKANPELQNFKTAQLNTQALKPAGKKVSAENPFQLRGINQFLQYGEAGKTIDVKFNTVWNHRPKEAIAMPVTVSDSLNVPIGEFKVDRGDFAYRFTPPYDGVFKFEIDTQGRSVIISSNAPGQGFGAAKIRMIHSHGSFYFNVPAELDKISVETFADINEPAEFQLIDPSGKVRASTPYEAGVKVLTVQRRPTAKPELWQLKIVKAQEDHGFRLGAPLQPIVYSSPDNRMQ